jgi:hypothetical protein
MSNKRKLRKRTSDEAGCSGATGTGSRGGGCTRRGYKTFLRLLREFIEVTENGNDIFEDSVEVEFVVKYDNGDALAVWYERYDESVERGGSGSERWTGYRKCCSGHRPLASAWSVWGFAGCSPYVSMSWET